MSIMRTLLMSVWTEFACLLANVFVSEFNRCLPKVFLDVFYQTSLSFCQCLFRRNLLMSAWTELACLLASIFLVSSIDAKSVFLPISFQEKSFWCLLEASHRLSVSVFLVGHLGSCWGGLACCPVSLNSLICLDVSLVSDGVGIQSSSVSGGCQLGVFPWVFQDSVSKPIRSSSGLPLH